MIETSVKVGSLLAQTCGVKDRLARLSITQAQMKTMSGEETYGEVFTHQMLAMR